MIVANHGVMKKINPSYSLIDYNDKEAFDCIIYDASERDLVFCELEPTIMEFLQHKRIPEELKLIIVWSIGKWRIGARKKGLKTTFELVTGPHKKNGRYRLLAYKQFNSKKPISDYEVVALEELLKK